MSMRGWEIKNSEQQNRQESLYQNGKNCHLQVELLMIFAFFMILFCTFKKFKK